MSLSYTYEHHLLIEAGKKSLKTYSLAYKVLQNLNLLLVFSAVPANTLATAIFFLTVPKMFELWCWRRLLRVPWTARRFNQSILKEISPGCSLEGLMLKLKLQYFGYLMRRVDSLEKALMLGKIEGRRRRGLQKMRWLGGTTNSMDMSLGKLLPV